MDLNALKEMFREAFTSKIDPESMDNYDSRITEALPLLDAFLKFYFRYEVRGIENVPEGSALLIGNHNAGITPMDPFIMGVYWLRVKGKDDPLYFVNHDTMITMPYLGNVLMKGGAVKGRMEVVKKVIDKGRKLVIYPGGNHEAFRKFTDRNKIDFGGHKGFAKLAIEKDVPIVPVVNVGQHETFFVLTSGQRLASLLGTDKLLRSKTFPITLGLPWGLSFGPIFHLPLPAKTEIEMGVPIYPSKCLDKTKTFEEQTDQLYEIVTGTMQTMLTRISSRRLLPVIGL